MIIPWYVLPTTAVLGRQGSALSLSLFQIMREVWESLNHAGKNWRQIFKGLTLLDVLLKHGSERVVDDARDHLFRIRTLTDFTHHEDGSDKGAGVREKAKQVPILRSGSPSPAP